MSSNGLGLHYEYHSMSIIKTNIKFQYYEQGFALLGDRLFDREELAENLARRRTFGELEALTNGFL